MGLGGEGAIAALYLLRLAALAGLVGFGILQARRRRPEVEEGSDLARRFLLPWLVIVVGFAIYLGLFTVLLVPAALFWVAAVVLLWVAVPAIASVAAVDLTARLLRAERTGVWLAAAIIAFVGLTLLWLGLFGLPVLALLSGLWQEVLALASIPVAAALIWWSFLPGEGGGDGGIAETFE